MIETLRRFLDCVEASDDRCAEAAAQALSDVSDGESAVLPTIRDLLSDVDADRRWWGVRALAAVGARLPPARLLDLLTQALDDADPGVRACAAQVAGELRLSGAVPALVRRLADLDPLAARVAADSLGRIGAPAVQPLIAALQAGETPVRAGAARALFIIQPEQAVVPLCEALDDPSAIVSHYASEALEQMGVGLLLFRPS
jgi:hypothetical protein